MNLRQKKRDERNYSIFAGLLILFVYAVSYFIREGNSPVYPTMAAVGFVLMFLILFLIIVSVLELFTERKLTRLNNLLSYSFVNLIGESIALIFSFFFYLSLMAAFDIMDNSLVIFQPISYLILTVFNHTHYKNKKTIGILAILGTIFLCVGLVAIFSRLFFIATALSLLLFSAVCYRVFKVEIKEEMRASYFNKLSSKLLPYARFSR